jgi:hypothetical protein
MARVETGKNGPVGGQFRSRSGLDGSNRFGDNLPSINQGQSQERANYIKSWVIYTEQAGVEYV